MNPQRQESYDAGQIEPGWQIFIDDQWLDVGVVIETEAPGGTRYITVAFADEELPAVKLHKAAIIIARPPQQQSTVEPGS